MSNSLEQSKQSRVQQFFLDLWYRPPHKRGLTSYLLLPITWLFRLVASIRSFVLKRLSGELPVPVVVVGNIAIGGTGKTPFVIALVKALTENGVDVGVISRGYGSAAPNYPYFVSSDSSPKSAGDEALLLAQEVSCPVVIDRNRVAAAKALLNKHPETKILISDDGLQHYNLSRQMEVILIDGNRGLGNGLCLPSGPLREAPIRLASAQWVFANGEVDDTQLHKQLQDLNEKSRSPRFEKILLSPNHWRNVISNKPYDLQPFPWLVKDQQKQVMALAAIGNPERFFTTLKDLGIGLIAEQNNGIQSLPISTMAFDDHYQFQTEDFTDFEDQVVLMTSKDAVKCRAFAKEQWWVLDVTTVLPITFIKDVMDLIHTN